MSTRLPASDLKPWCSMSVYPANMFCLLVSCMARRWDYHPLQEKVQLWL